MGGVQAIKGGLSRAAKRRLTDPINQRTNHGQIKYKMQKKRFSFSFALFHSSVAHRVTSEAGVGSHTSKEDDFIPADQTETKEEILFRLTMETGKIRCK